jgi:hypothetical protein
MHCFIAMIFSLQWEKWYLLLCVTRPSWKLRWCNWSSVSPVKCSSVSLSTCFYKVHFWECGLTSVLIRTRYTVLQVLSSAQGIYLHLQILSRISHDDVRDGIWLNSSFEEKSSWNSINSIWIALLPPPNITAASLVHLPLDWNMQ